MTKSYDPLVEKVRNYFRNAPRMEIRQEAELAPGIVCVYNSGDEWDVYFDTSRWDFKDPKLWNMDNPLQYIKNLRLMGIGLLPGTGCYPPVKDFDHALSLAKNQLEAQWYDIPMVIGQSSD